MTRKWSDIKREKGVPDDYRSPLLAPAVTSEYGITVEALDDKDAADIAKRRARDDGFVVVTVKRVSRGILPGRWAVLLAVRKS